MDIHVYIEFNNEIKINNRKILNDLSNKIFQGYNCSYYTDIGETKPISVLSDETIEDINLVRFEKNKYDKVDINEYLISLYYHNDDLLCESPYIIPSITKTIDNIMQYYKELGLTIDSTNISIQDVNNIAERIYPWYTFLRNGYNFTTDIGYHFRVVKDHCIYIFDMEGIYDKELKDIKDISKIKCGIYIARETRAIQDPLQVKQFILDTPNSLIEFKNTLLQNEIR